MHGAYPIEGARKPRGHLQRRISGVEVGRDEALELRGDVIVQSVQSVQLDTVLS
jgi:hypothetical protein